MSGAEPGCVSEVEGWDGVATPGVEFSFPPNMLNAVTLYHAAQEMAHRGGGGGGGGGR